MDINLKEPLTDREQEVLIYVVKGLTNNEIGDILTISHHTVKAHIASILRKMGARNRLEAAVLASHTGLVSPHQG